MKRVVPLVAIHCITYNHELYIRDCLEGFVMQKTNFKFVAIVHDDASTDGTAAIIKEYAEKYPDIIKPILETENQYSKKDGSIQRIMSDAINATGAKYVAMCEGDDYWIDPYKLQKQVDFMEKHSVYVMCFHNVEVLSSNVEEEKNLYNHLETRCYTDTEILSKWTVPTCSVLYRNNLLKQNPNYKKIVFGDIFLFLRLAQYGKLYCINEKMAIYRRTSEGVSSGNKSQTVLLNLYSRLARQYYYMSCYFKLNYDISKSCCLQSSEYCNYIIYSEFSTALERLKSINFRYFFIHDMSIKEYILKFYAYILKKIFSIFK